MTNEQRQTEIRALLTERRGYEAAGKKDRIAQVDAELRRLGAEGAPMIERAEKRPSKRKGVETR